MRNKNVKVDFKPLNVFTRSLPTALGQTPYFTVKRCGLQNRLP